VQGVFFRHSTREKANTLGVSGWVRNCPDGTVELEACGNEAAVEELIAWCRIGPPSASVSDVEIAERWVEQEEKQGAARFEITH
jgi:acylphosphatase